MLVRCINMKSHDGTSMNASDFLTLGRDYLVIGMTIRPRRPMDYHLVGDDGTPVYQRADQFELRDAAIPSGWVGDASSDPARGCAMGYPQIMEPGFLESYFDGDKAATATLMRTLQECAAEAGTSVPEISSYSTLETTLNAE